MKPLPTVDISRANCVIMRDWASVYGAAVRQWTMWQETTMAKHGTHPEYKYQWHRIDSEKPINVLFKEANEQEDWRT